jgi:hypothetical protein
MLRKLTLMVPRFSSGRRTRPVPARVEIGKEGVELLLRGRGDFSASKTAARLPDALEPFVSTMTTACARLSEANAGFTGNVTIRSASATS